MKKLFFLLCVAAIAFTSCQESAYSDETKALVGKYKGTATLIKQNADSTQSQAKEYTLTFKQNPLNMDNLLWQSLIELVRVKEGVYQLNDNAITREMLNTAIEYFKVGEYIQNYLGTAEYYIDKIDAEAKFVDNTVNLKIYYDITLYGVEAQVVVATFEGTKID